MQFPKSILLILNKSPMYRKVLLNWMALVMSCFIVLIMKSYSKVGAHGYTNNLPENGVSKANVDVVDKKVNSETKLSTREVCVPHGHPISRPESAKRIGSNESFSLFV